MPTFAGPRRSGPWPTPKRSADQFRSSTGPAKPGTDHYKKQAQELIDLSAGLTEQQKVMAYYWAEEPPPRLWNQFAQFVSHRDGHGADLKGTAIDVKLFFALSNALHDAGIAGWADKAHFDYVRPITAIRSLFSGQKINAWGGPGKGTPEIDGEDWIPYGPATFRTPPFAGCVSGHSVFTTAGAELLKRFTGSDTFGHSVTIKAGAGGYEPGVPAADVTLRWNTFSAAGDEASMSRRYGGYHFEQGDVDGRELGRKVAGAVWVRRNRCSTRRPSTRRSAAEDDVSQTGLVKGPCRSTRHGPSDRVIGSSRFGTDRRGGFPIAVLDSGD